MAQMTLKCPHCRYGCERCTSGIVVIDFVPNKIWKSVCRECGNLSGAEACMGNDQPAPIYRPCINCAGMPEWIEEKE